MATSLTEWHTLPIADPAPGGSTSTHYHGSPSLRTPAGIVCPQCEQPARGPAGHKPVPLPPKYRHALHAVYECRQCGLSFSPR